jgi:serine/threonine-protein kinase
VETTRRLLGNRYELLSVLASGGMGRVWRGRDVLLNRPVAVKVLRSEFTGDPAFVSRFRAEAQHAALLQHPNIAAVFDYGELEEQGERLAYLVMELVEGESLATLLARERRLDVPRTLSVLRQTAAALAAAHAAGVVHRDVKPGNVLVGRDGAVKIADFGIAWSASSVPLTSTGQVIGTAHYLSPEQAAGGKATPASDVYALGAVAYECLAGRRAFEGENSVQVAVMHIREEPDPLPAGTPPEVRRIVEHAMAKDPAARFRDGAALLRAVEQLPATLTAGARSAAVAEAPSMTMTTRTAPIVAPVAPVVPVGHTHTAVMPMPLAGAGAGPAGVVGTDPVGAAAAGGRTPRAGRRALLLVLAGALAVVALVGIAVALLGSGAEQSAGNRAPTGTTAPTATTPAGVDVAAADYVGRPVAEVQAALVGAGLSVSLSPAEIADVPAGQVTAVSPVGALPAGSAVTITYAVPPAPVVTTAPPAPDNAGDAGDQNGNNGNGNGKGHGKGNGKKDD